VVRGAGDLRREIMETTKTTLIPCGECGMMLQAQREYHSFTVCKLFQYLRDSDTVRGNIKAVIEYGMKAQKAGISSDDAMADFNLVIRSEN
jgi:hypothetical protein